MSSDSISLQEVADRLGVHYMTAYRYVRLGILPAVKLSGKWFVAISDVETFGVSSRPSRGEADWTARLESRMLAGDISGSWGVVEAAMTSGASPKSVYLDILTPALHSVGNRWERNEIGVDEEHLATAVAGRIVGRLSPMFARRGRNKETVVLAAPPDDQHGLATAILADILRSYGYDAFDLGPKVPPDSLVSTVVRSGSRVVVLSISYSEAIAGAGHMVAVLREGVESVRVIVGGSAISDRTIADGCGADDWAESADHLLELLDAG